MKPEDFSQFDDPRVRAVMAAAANLVEETITVLGEFESDRKLSNGEQVLKNLAETLATVLFAAQHSKPKSKCDCYDDGVGSVLGPSCQVHRTHEHPIEYDKWGFGKPVTNRFNVDGSKPGGKAFINAVEHVQNTCLGGCECPRCGEKCDKPLKRCTRCWGDGYSMCQCEVRE